ncbi:hypothetical protein Pcinc_009159 [Petrolisthes cinctipes]|nr:hypothetical protein Pcinc_009159 [Petrolisthes cinctipes]
MKEAATWADNRVLAQRGSADGLEKVKGNDTVDAYGLGNVFPACTVTRSMFQLAQEEEEVSRSSLVDEHIGSSETQPSDAPDMNLARENEDSDSSCVEGVLVPPECSRDHIVGELAGAAPPRGSCLVELRWGLCVSDT